MYADGGAGALGFDTDGDGRPDSATKLKLLASAVLKKCDKVDGIEDGVIGDPTECPFDPELDLKDKLCAADRDRDDCFTLRQIQSIKSVYRGPHDSKGVRIYWGRAFGAELGLASRFLITPGQDPPAPAAFGLSSDVLNYMFYENDPGVPPPGLLDATYKPDKKANPPEWSFWEFNVDDVTAGKGNAVMANVNATDPDLARFLIRPKGKLLLYHGWNDPGPAPAATIDYFTKVIQKTFSGKSDEAQKQMRLFMAPGMEHCAGGPGPNTWDKLAPMVDWVQNGKAPDLIVARHSTNGRVDNERPLCPYPKQAVYTGAPGGQQNPANWVAANFTCR
jgi:feruloyl esterase